MRKILSFKDFSLFEYQNFLNNGSNSLNEQVYLDIREKRNINQEAFKKFRAAAFYLSIQYPFFGSLITRLMVRETKDPRYKTMCTDGVSIHYNAEFVLKLREEEIAWVIAHEILHCALGHFERTPKDLKHHAIWNYATDYALNQILTPVDMMAYNMDPNDVRPSAKGSMAKIKMVEGSLYPGCGAVPYDKEFVNQTAEHIYKKLIDNGFSPDVKDTGDTPKPPPPPPPPPDPVQVGDIIYDPDNKTYGIVKSLDENNDSMEYDPIPDNQVRDYLNRIKKGENLLGDELDKEIDF